MLPAQDDQKAAFSSHRCFAILAREVELDVRDLPAYHVARERHPSTTASPPSAVLAIFTVESFMDLSTPLMEVGVEA